MELDGSAVLKRDERHAIDYLCGDNGETEACAACDHKTFTQMVLGWDPEDYGLNAFGRRLPKHRYPIAIFDNDDDGGDWMRTLVGTPHQAVSGLLGLLSLWSYWKWDRTEVAVLPDGVATRTPTNWTAS